MASDRADQIDLLIRDPDAVQFLQKDRHDRLEGNRMFEPIIKGDGDGISRPNEIGKRLHSDRVGERTPNSGLWVGVKRHLRVFRRSVAKYGGGVRHRDLFPCVRVLNRHFLHVKASLFSLCRGLRCTNSSRFPSGSTR